MTPRKTFLAVFTAAALAVAASGAAARGPGAGPGPAAGPHAPLALQRLAELKTALQLTPEQQTAWAGYEQAVTRAATGRQKLQQSMRQARGTPMACGPHPAEPGVATFAPPAAGVVIGSRGSRIGGRRSAIDDRVQARPAAPGAPARSRPG